MPFVSIASMEQFAYEALKNFGVDSSSASDAASGMSWASCRGVRSHGFGLLTHYLEEVEKKIVNGTPKFTFNRVSPSLGFVDGDGGLGHSVGKYAMENAIELARETGIGFVTAGNSSHAGAMGFFGQIATKADMIGICMTNASPRVKSHGGTRAFVGTNPICVAAPMAGEDSFCFDSSVTNVSFNEVRRRAMSGSKLEPGWAADSKGNDTVDPNEAVQLIPIGGYKGFGLALAIEILTSMLSGMPSAPNVSPMFETPHSSRRRLSHSFIALNHGLITEGKLPDRLSMMAQELRSEPTLEEVQKVMLPGDPEKMSLLETETKGCYLTDNELVEMIRLASDLEIAPPKQTK